MTPAAEWQDRLVRLVGADDHGAREDLLQHADLLLDEPALRDLVVPFESQMTSALASSAVSAELPHEVFRTSAHIIPDSESDGDPEISNGLSLCKLHHAAFDHHFLGITPDYRIVIRQDLKEETDGPMLTHGLQGMQGQAIILSRSTAAKPSRDRLALRYKLFQDQQPTR